MTIVADAPPGRKLFRAPPGSPFDHPLPWLLPLIAILVALAGIPILLNI
jgi:hypothetical protein